MRIAVRAESMAALPPPMMTTRVAEIRRACPAPRLPGNAASRSTPFRSLPGRRTRVSFQVPSERNTASNWSSRSLSEMSAPMRELQTNFTPRRRMISISRSSTLRGRRYSGSAIAQHAARLGVRFVARRRRVPAARGRTRRSARPVRRRPPRSLPGRREPLGDDALPPARRTGRRAGSESAMKRCTSRMLTARRGSAGGSGLSQGCWQTRPVEAGSGLSMITDSNASSSRPSL